MANPAIIPGGYAYVPGTTWQPGDYSVGGNVYRASNPNPLTGPGIAGASPVQQPIMQKVAANLQNAANGELPPDVVNQIRQHAAEFGLAAGLPGSEFAGNAGLKQLGLTSLARTDYANNATLPWFMTPMQANQVYLQGRQLGDQEREINNAESARLFAQNQYQQKQAADAWNAGRVDPWARTGSTPVVNWGAAPGSTGMGAHPGGAPAGGPPTATGNYGADVSNFFSKYLPGAGRSGAMSFQGGPVDLTTAPITPDEPVSSYDLPAAEEDPDWFD